MSNWMIVRQEATIGKGDAKETILVDCKSIDWRPSSAKEIQQGADDFKRLGTPTFRILYRHKKWGGDTKIVAQYVKTKRSGKLVKIAGVQQYEWRVNLHHPDVTKPKQLLMPQRVTCVSIDCPSGEMVTEKSSTGTAPYDSFFKRVLPENLRDADFRTTIQGLLDDAIYEREQAKQAA